MNKVQNKITIQALLCMWILLCITAPLCAQQAAEKAEPTPSLCLNGIIFDEQNPIAVINGDSFRPGDVIEGAQIVTIAESSVTFEFNGTAFSRGLGEGCDSVKAATHAIEKTLEEATRQIQTNIASSRQKTIPKRITLDKAPTREELATLGILLFVLLLMYAYSAVTLQLVAKKTGTGSSWLAWIPIGNIFLMCMIAHRPLWWAVLLLILPLTIIGILPALVMMVIVLMDIAAACSKPKWLAFLTVIPFISGIGWLFFWGYLAFSKIETSDGACAERIPEVKSEPTKAPEPSAPPPAAPEKPSDDKPTQGPAQEPPKSNSEDEPPIYNA